MESVEELRQEAWEIHQKIGKPQQGREAQEAWDAMQEKHLALVEEKIKEMEMKKKTDLERAADLIQMTVLRRSDMNNLVNKRWRREHGLR
tara:strand:+ start:436 stop:705 length:270 start_codon:yes stop_codon:yes gene_type:complete